MRHIKDLANDHLIQLTVRTYQNHFENFRAGVQPVSDKFQTWLDDFASRLPPQGKIFELGSGTGRDARYFAAKSLKVTCTDVVQEALQALSCDGFDTAEYDFRSLPKPEWIGAFDGYFANGVLAHASPDVLPHAITNSARILKPGGTAGLSFKVGDGWRLETKKMGAPRYFNYQRLSLLQKVLAGAGLKVLNTVVLDNLVPGENPWMFIITQKQ